MFVLVLPHHHCMVNALLIVVCGVIFHVWCFIKVGEIYRYKDVIKVLAKMGYKRHSQTGSHVKFKNEDNIVIVPKHKEIAKGTFKSILNSINLSLDDFKNLL